MFIYLMQDNHTKLIKIGRSADALKRERTLLSQAPSIQLLYKWQRNNSSDERRLHKMYEAQRVRGEWFDLSEADITCIRRFMDNYVEVDEAVEHKRKQQKPRYMRSADSKNTLIEVYRCSCDKCGHIWVTKQKQMPRVCSKCKNSPKHISASVVEVWRCQCSMCKHEWTTKAQELPKVCPKCKNYEYL